MKKKCMKQLLSLLIVFVLTISMVPTIVFADATSDSTQCSEDIGTNVTETISTDYVEIRTNLTNLTLEGDTLAKVTESYTVRITPAEGYLVPTTVTVNNGSWDLRHNYDVDETTNTGILTIDTDILSGAAGKYLIIKATAVTPEAQIGDEYYRTFDEALDAANANGGTIVLRKDYLCSGKDNPQITGDVTIDSNGYKFSVSSARFGQLTVESGASLTLTGNGILMVGTNKIPIVVQSGGEIIVDKDLTMKTEQNVRYTAIENHGTTIFRGTGPQLDNKESGTAYIYGNLGMVFNEGGVANIYDGAVLSGYQYPIENRLKGTVNIFGGSISGTIAITASSGTINIEGGTISCPLEVGLDNYNYASDPQNGKYLVSGGSFPNGIEVQGTTYDNGELVTIADIIDPTKLVWDEDGNNITDLDVTKISKSVYVSAEKIYLELEESDFEVTLPNNLIYDGLGKNVSVIANPALTGVGAITVHYYDEKGVELNNAPVSVGTYTVKVTVDQGSKFDAITSPMEICTFTIQPKSIESDWVTLDNNSFEYDGTDKEPEVVVYDDQTTLVEGTDYLVAYTDNTDAGTGVVEVTGINNYTGTTSVNFTINPVSLEDKTATLEETSFSYTGDAIEPEVIVEDLEEGTDYEVFYLNNINVGTATVRVEGKGNYSGVIELDFTIDSLDISDCEVSLSDTSYAYDGSEKKPEVIVKDGIKTLVVGTDYTVSYKNNTNAGTATVTITGKGVYTGTISKNFTIKKQSASKFKVSLSKTNYTYTGSAMKPSVTVYDANNKKLVSGTDYTVSYAAGRTKVGKYKVTVTFKGNYSGSKALYFVINPKNPSTVKTELYGYNDVKVSWSKVSEASGYKLYYKKSSSSKWTLLKTTTSTSYKKANLSDGVKYDFKVVAYNKVSGSTYESSGKTSSIYTLKKVTGVKVAKSGSKVKVSWTNISGETGYQISQSTSKTGTKIVATYNTTSGKNKTISVEKGKTYYYKVRTYKTVGKTKIYGPWSTVVKYKR